VLVTGGQFGLEFRWESAVTSIYSAVAETSMRWALFASLIFACAFSANEAFACKCVAPPPEIKSARELAKWEAVRANAIFEGTVATVELKSRLVEASAGDIVPASLDASDPELLVTFLVRHSYRGEQQKTIVVHTGLGGGDCGFRFEIGKQYLVYAYRDESDQLSTGICSGTALLDDSRSNLAYLRGDPIIPRAPHTTAAKAGQLCVRIIPNNSTPDLDEKVWLFRVGDISPVFYDEAELNEKGLFCSGQVEPGNYRLLYLTMYQESPTSFVYYPGTMSVPEAGKISIAPGQIKADLVFKIPPQKMFSVAGSVSTSNNSPLPAKSRVLLLSMDQPFMTLAYEGDIGANGSFTLPKVLSGRYWAILDVDFDSAAPGWSTRKIELVVDKDVNDLPLVLIAN